MTNSFRLKISRRTIRPCFIFISLCTFSGMMQSCMMSGQDLMQRQSLFGSVQISEKEPQPIQKNSFGLELRSAKQNENFELKKLEGNVWRTGLNAAQVYGMLARIVTQSYVIKQADRKNLSIQTDWDKFFIDGRLFRNRISVSIFPMSTRQTEVIIKNTLEYYSGQMGTLDDANNQAWLPSPDLTDELPRIIDSLNRQTALLGAGSRSLR